MANDINSKDQRITFYGGELKQELVKKMAKDPRFLSLTKYVAHLVAVGLENDTLETPIKS